MPQYGYQQPQAMSFDSGQTIRRLTQILDTRTYGYVASNGRLWAPAFFIAIEHTSAPQAQRQGLGSYHGPLAFGCQQNPEADGIIPRSRAAPTSQLRRVCLSIPRPNFCQLQHNHRITRQDTRKIGRILSNNPAIHAKAQKSKHAWWKGYENIIYRVSRPKSFLLLTRAFYPQERLAERPVVRQVIPARHKSRTRQRPACRYVSSQY